MCRQVVYTQPVGKEDNKFVHYFIIVYKVHLFGEALSSAMREDVIRILLTGLSLKIQLFVFCQGHLLEVVLFRASIEPPRLGRCAKRIDIVQKEVLVMNKDCI